MKPSQIRVLRKKLGVTQSQLARKLGVNRAAVCQWEHGKQKPLTLAVKFMELLEWLHDRGIEYGQEEKDSRNLRTRE
jgi:DNA-binding transcriptional regulator YiaG